MRLESIVLAFHALFAVEDDHYFALQRSSVSRAIAAYLGVKWSPRFSAKVAAVALAAGVRRVKLHGGYYYTGVRVKKLSPDEARKHAKQVRKGANIGAPPRADLIAAARAIMQRGT